MTREVPLLMPKLSMTMETGEVLSWFKSEGDAVAAGDPIAEVQTDKVDMEVESPVTGTLVRIIAGPGAVLDVGAPMGFITSDAEDLMAGLFDPAPPPSGESPAKDSDAPARSASTNGGPFPDATPVSRQGPLPVVPLARRRAAQLRVSLDEVVPTGPNGLITLADVEKAATVTATVPTQPAVAGKPLPPSEAHPLPAASTTPAHVPQMTSRAKPPTSGDAAPDPGFADALAPRRRAIRSAVARTMAASAAIPQFTIFADLDLEPVNQIRNGVGWTTLLIRGLARALRRHPHINAGWDDAAGAPMTPHDNIGIALAIDSAVGLLAPVIRDPDKLSVKDLDALFRATVDRARTGKLSAADIHGATSTLSNLGGFGVPSFTSLLTPPQATALSVGAIAPRPVIVGGGIAVRLGTTLGLTIDHRPVDGADGARLLADLRDLFQHPDKLLS